MNLTLTPKDLIAFLSLLLVSLVVAIVQRRSILPTAPPANANPKFGVESDVNKDRRPGGE